MSLGTAFASGPSPRSTFIETLIKTLDIDVEIQNDATDERFIANFPLKKRPVFLSNDNNAISETIAVAIYLCSISKNPEYSGKNDLDRASVLQWLSFANSDLINPIIQLFSANGDEQKIAAAAENANKLLHYVSNRLSKRSFLVSNYETVADLLMTAVLKSVLKHLSNVPQAKDYPNFDKYFNTINKN